MNFPTDRQYTAEHEWIDSQGQVGITDYAQDALGDVVFVDLPAVGNQLQIGDTFGVVESVKSVSDLYSPVQGVVEAVNDQLVDHPEWINEDPYGKGWIIRLRTEKLAEDLLSAEQYRQQVGEGKGGV